MEISSKREELLQAIIRIELAMFTTVKAVEPAPCQQMLSTFKAMRRMSHSVLADDTLSSYFNDLQKAQEAGRNLVTEKYARMDNLIPPINTNPVIGEIVKIEWSWMKALNEKYPLAVKIKGGFEIYAACELETYSDHTLRLYYRDISNGLQAGKNLVEERYTTFYKGLGFKSIEDAENQVIEKMS